MNPAERLCREVAMRLLAAGVVAADVEPQENTHVSYPKRPYYMAPVFGVRENELGASWRVENPIEPKELQIHWHRWCDLFLVKRSKFASCPFDWWAQQLDLSSNDMPRYFGAKPTKSWWGNRKSWAYYALGIFRYAYMAYEGKVSDGPGKLLFVTSDGLEFGLNRGRPVGSDFRQAFEIAGGGATDLGSSYLMTNDLGTVHPSALSRSLIWVEANRVAVPDADEVIRGLVMLGAAYHTHASDVRARFHSLMINHPLNVRLAAIKHARNYKNSLSHCDFLNDALRPTGLPFASLGPLVGWKGHHVGVYPTPEQMERVDRVLDEMEEEVLIQIDILDGFRMRSQAQVAEYINKRGIRHEAEPA